MKRSTALLLLIIISSFYTCNTVEAQQSYVHNDADKHYKLGLALFDREKYGAAQAEFTKTIANTTISYETRTNAQYYQAACALELYNNDAEQLITRFIDNHPESIKKSAAIFRLAKHYYKQKTYKEAILWFQKVDLYYLQSEEVTEYFFKLGYSYFNIGDNEKASKAFFQVKSTKSKYANAASFYYAFVEYNNLHLDAALQGFNAVKNVDPYAKVVPTYIAQIYYLQKKYDALIDFATPLLSAESPQNTPEIAHILGDAYHKKSRYEEAIPLTEAYQLSGGVMSAGDRYQLGYAYYKTNNLEKALNQFEKIIDADDSIAQNALYTMGDCFLKVGRKQSARNAFMLASNMSFDKQVQQDALFNFGKLSTELNFPTEAITALQNYMSMYPAADNWDEASGILAELYMSTRNYKEAFAALERIRIKNDKTKRAYQKIAYYRGIELMTNGELEEPIKLFDKSLSYAVDPKFTALTKYWKGEALYKSNNYVAANRNYYEFINSPYAVALPVYNTAHYNLGYCYFKKEDYANALFWFRKYVKDRYATDTERYMDALLRIADCFFMTKEYANAIDNYDTAINNHAAASDYALYQKGVILGILGKNNEKITTLERIADKYPSSPYIDEALYEMGNASVLLEDNLQAINLYNQLIDRYPNSNYVRKSMLGIALLYYNEKRDQKALDLYKQIITQFPNSIESKEALTGIKNIYVNAGDADSYLNYIKNLPEGSITASSQDTITFEAAEQRYMRDDCAGAVSNFTEYVKRYNSGAFTVNAYFYMAECAYNEKNYEKALEGYSYVISKPQNTFSEKSLLKAASIEYRFKNYTNALEHYARLEKIAEFKSNILDARVGQMRCAMQLGKYDLAGVNAIRIITSDKIAADLQNEAHLTYGKVAFNKDSLSIAVREFSIVAQAINTENGAEAKYYLALIRYKIGKYKDCEKMTLELAKQSSSDYWVAKGYILLADAYVALKDNFQAKATLKSIIDNYEGDDLKKEAQDKLDEILLAESAYLKKDLKNNETENDSVK